MAKRRATTELNRDNWDKDEPSEDPGTFKRITGDELKNRVIRKARRTIASTGSGSSPFAAFSGFNKLGGNTNPFNFLKNDTSGEANSLVHSSLDTKEKKENGNSGNEEAESTNKKPEKSESISEEKKSGDSVLDRKDSTDSNISSKSTLTHSIEYYRQLQSLNESVMKWMQLHLSKNPCCDFTPVFNDYKKHLDTINVTYPVKEKSSESTSLFHQSVSKEDSSSQKSSTKTVNYGFSFDNNLNNSNDDETDYGANFKSNTTNTSTFSFGISKTPTATSSISSGPTTSLREEVAPEKKPFQFSFGLNPLLKNTDDPNASKPFTFASVPMAKNSDMETGASEEQEYVPPKNDFVAVKEEDALYSKRCKLFYKKDDTYVERGIGTLHLKPLDGKTQLLIRADTSLGNILLNIILSDSLPMSRTGKNNVLLVCVPNPPLVPNKSDSKESQDSEKADTKEAIPLLIRVKTSEDADDLLETLNKYKS